MIQTIFPVFCFVLFANFGIIFTNVLSLVQCVGNTIWRSCWKHGCGVTTVSWVLAYISTQTLSFLSLSCWCLAHAAVTTALNRVGLSLALGGQTAFALHDVSLMNGHRTAAGIKRPPQTNADTTDNLLLHTV